MDIKIGDVFKDRYVLKMIMLDPNNSFQPIFLLLDKNINSIIEFNKKEMETFLGISNVKGCEQ